MTKLRAMSYDLIITGQNEESKRLIISIGDLNDTEAAILAADISNFILHKDYILSKNKKDAFKDTIKDIYRGGYTHAVAPDKPYDVAEDPDDSLYNEHIVGQCFNPD